MGVFSTEGLVRTKSSPSLKSGTTFSAGFFELKSSWTCSWPLGCCPRHIDFAGYPMVNNDEMFVPTGGVTDTAAIAVSLHNRFA